MHPLNRLVQDVREKFADDELHHYYAYDVTLYVIQRAFELELVQLTEKDQLAWRLREAKAQ